MNIHPLEVESQLAACPCVIDVAVTALADPVWGDVLVALVVSTNAGETEIKANLQTIDAWCRQHLTSALRPRHIFCVASLPRNAMGKIERSALRTMAITATATA